MLQFSVSQRKKKTKNKEQKPIQRQLEPMSLFIYTQLKNLYVCKGICAAEGCVAQTRRAEEENTTQQAALAPVELALNDVFILSRPRPPLPTPHRSTTVLLPSTAPLSHAVRGPLRGPLQGPFRSSRGRTAEMVLSGGCQEVVSPYWAPLTEWPHGRGWSMPAS